MSTLLCSFVCHFLAGVGQTCFSLPFQSTSHKGEELTPKMGSKHLDDMQGPRGPLAQNLELCGGAAHAKCLVDGTNNEDRNYLVIASNSACLGNRAEFGSEVLELNGLSSDSGHTLSS